MELLMDAENMINITGERNHIGDTQMTMAPYLLIRHWWGWEPVEMYYDVALLFDKSKNTIPRSYAFMQESSVLEKGRYTVISIGNDSLRKNGVSIENVYDNIGTKAILLSADTLGYDVQKARWFTWVYKDEGIYAFSKDLSYYCYLFVIRDMADDYEFHFGTETITAKDISSLLSGQGE